MPCDETNKAVVHSIPASFGKDSRGSVKLSDYFCVTDTGKYDPGATMAMRVCFVPSILPTTNIQAGSWLSD